MTEMFTIEVSDETVQRAREAASLTGQTIEAVLSAWLEQRAITNEIWPPVDGAVYPIYTPVGNEAAAQKMWELRQERKRTQQEQDQSE